MRRISLLISLVLTFGACATVSSVKQTQDKPGVLYLARHGQTEWNRVSRFQGDPDLDQIGYLNRVSLWMLLKDVPLHTIYTSDKLRTKRTAELVAKSHNLQPRSRAELSEINSGILAGICFKYMEPTTTKKNADQCPVFVRGSHPELARKEVEKVWQEIKKGGIYAKAPLGENYPDMKARLAPLLKEIRQELKKGNVLAVGHGLINRVALNGLLGWPVEKLYHLRQENDQVYRIEGLHLNDASKVNVFLYSPGHEWKQCSPPTKDGQRQLDCHPKKEGPKTQASEKDVN